MNVDASLNRDVSDAPAKRNAPINNDKVNDDDVEQYREVAYSAFRVIDEISWSFFFFFFFFALKTNVNLALRVVATTVPDGASCVLLAF
jgi:hypothetical protein